MQVYSFHPGTGFYVGTTIADESPLEPGVWLMPAHTTEIAPPAYGDGQLPKWTGSAWTLESVVPVPDVPDAISDRQFFQQLAVNGTITQAEALAAVQTGAIPAVLEAFVDALPEADQFGARMLLSGATVFLRDHPLTAAIGAAQGMDSAEIDAFFIAADKL